MRAVFAELPRRAHWPSAVAIALLIAAPLLLDRYALSILIVILNAAYLGCAWNIMMGFAGLLSIGHALYAGLGAYVSAALFVHFGVPALIGLLPGAAVAALAGAFVAWLGFRFRIGGVYFALLTIAFAEVARIGFDQIDWTGGSGGLFIPVDAREHFDLLRLRGGIDMFYYVILGLAAAAVLISRHLVRSRLGYYWLAIREDEEAARALGIDVFRARIAAVAISAAMTAVAGTFNAFYNNNLFPEHVFAIGRSIDIILAPIVGGLGTLMGPLVGAFMLAPLGELLLTFTGALRLDLPGLELVLHGIILVVIIRALPGGVWPWLARRLGLEARAEGGAL
jgi:branched-chain amino acid transport system permease protein